MKIAMIGIRGIPASYSGFETAAEELSAGLVERGHEVTVYNRTKDISYGWRSYRGAQLVRLPTWRSKHLSTIVHSFLATLHVLTTRAEIVHYYGAGPGALSWLARLSGKKTVCSVDGLDWSRRKWGGFARTYLRASEALVTKTSDAVITDSPVGEVYYREKYGLETAMIAYGARVRRQEGTARLAQYGLEPRRYVLFVGRLVPEKNVHHLIEAFERLETDMKLVIVGDDPFEKEYVESLRKHAGPRIVFTGYLYGEGCAELQSNAYVFVLPAEVGGRSPVLLEAMGFGNCVVVSDTPSNLEAIGEAGVSYNVREGANDLARKLDDLISRPARVAEYRERAQQHAARHYLWDEVVAEHERLYGRLLGENGREEKQPRGG